MKVNFRLKSLKEWCVFAILRLINAENAISHYTGDESWQEIYDFLLAHWRYAIWYAKRINLIRPYIRTQIQARFTSMDQDCYNNGSCKLCGCDTTQLQMANKACKKPCYPSLMSRRELKKMRSSHVGYYYDIKTKTHWKFYNGKFIQVDSNGEKIRKDVH